MSEHRDGRGTGKLAMPGRRRNLSCCAGARRAAMVPRMPYCSQCAQALSDAASSVPRGAAVAGPASGTGSADRSGTGSADRAGIAAPHRERPPRRRCPRRRCFPPPRSARTSRARRRRRRPLRRRRSPRPSTDDSRPARAGTRYRIVMLGRGGMGARVYRADDLEARASRSRPSLPPARRRVRIRAKLTRFRGECASLPDRAPERLPRV